MFRYVVRGFEGGLKGRMREEGERGGGREGLGEVEKRGGRGRRWTGGVVEDGSRCKLSTPSHPSYPSGNKAPFAEEIPSPILSQESTLHPIQILGLIATFNGTTWEQSWALRVFIVNAEEGMLHLHISINTAAPQKR